MTKRILIMGLPGSGKTTLATELTRRLELASRAVDWFNADAIRKQYDDWDFSNEGRLRQASRMRFLADQSTLDFVICDFVAPLVHMRDLYAADYTIWVDTIEQGRFADTNTAFIKPEVFDIRVTEQDAIAWADKIILQLLQY